MINYLETKKTLEIRGVSFDEMQYNFCLQVALNSDKLMAYLTTIKHKEYSKFKEKSGKDYDSFIDKCNKECEILLEQQNIKQLVDYIKDKFEVYVADYANECEEITITPRLLKGLMSKVLLKMSKSLDTTAYSDLIRIIDSFNKNFPLDTENDQSFSRHFIQVYPKPFNGVCSVCGKEIDIPYPLSFTCPHCMTKYIYDDEAEKYRVNDN